MVRTLLFHSKNISSTLIESIKIIIFKMFLNLFIFFICFIILISSVFILINQNPVSAILLLILIFFCVSCLLIVNNFIFFSFFFLSIYIGAIAIFFLFVLRLIHIPIYAYPSNSKLFYSLFCLISCFGFFKNFCNSIVTEANIYNFNDIYVSYNGLFDSLNYIGNTFYTSYSIFLFILMYIFIIVLFGTLAILQHLRN
jgi:NADH:ubiquinone oxidoreductase subunit 6 (subunit J)